MIALIKKKKIQPGLRCIDTVDRETSKSLLSFRQGRGRKEGEWIAQEEELATTY